MWYPKTENNRIEREEKFKSQLFETNPKLELTGKYINSTTNVEFRCNQCGEENQISNPRSLINRDTGCVKCDGKRKILVGYNDLATTHPHFVSLFKHEEEAKTVKSGSNKKFLMMCPICGNERFFRVADLKKRGFSCPKCGDGFSYPNRFMFNMLSQLKVDFDNELSFDWSENKRYDFIFDSYIIEMDGGFHKGSKYRSYEDAKIIDDLKDRLAIENGYEVIRIDCCKNEFINIKNNVLNSKLSSIFDLENFDWVELEKELVTNNMVKVASELFNKHREELNMSDIASMMNIQSQKLCSLLKVASRIGLTDYEPSLATSGHYTPNKPKVSSRKCICLDNGKVFDSCKQAEDYYNLGKDAIARVCRGERLTVKNMKFDFLDTTEEIQLEKKRMEEVNSKPSHSSKRVMCVETGQIYNSSKEASLPLGFNDKYVSTLISRNKKTKEGYTFKYI